MKRVLPIYITFLLFSCSEKTEHSENVSDQILESKVSVVKKNSGEDIEISKEEMQFNRFLDSLEVFKIQPVDSLEIEYKNKKIENYKIGKNKIQLFKGDSFNLDSVKINSEKFTVENLKTINPRTDGEREEVFGNSIWKIKLYNYNNDDILFLEFNSYPCTGLGCGVFDYLIYSTDNKEVNLFGSFRTADVDLYDFPLNETINYISTEYQGDYHGTTPIHFISRIYSMNNNGIFTVEKDKSGDEYYYKKTIYLNDSLKEFEYEKNWF